MNPSSTHSRTRRCAAALAALVVTVPVALLAMGPAATAAPASASAAAPAPAAGAADRTGSRPALGSDRPGDTKGPFGPVGERTSHVPDVPGQRVVEPPAVEADLVSTSPGDG